MMLCSMMTVVIVAVMQGHRKVARRIRAAISKPNELLASRRLWRRNALGGSGTSRARRHVAMPLVRWSPSTCLSPTAVKVRLCRRW